MRNARVWTQVVLVMAGFVAGAARAQAQEPELVTDRPDFTESSEVVGRGFVQFETGFSYERQGTRADPLGIVTVPSSLGRIGVSSRIELRVGTDGIISSSGASERVTGMADLEAGVKIRLFNQAQTGVDVAVIPMASFPAGSDDVSSGAVDPTIKLTWARELPGGFGLSGNYNVASLTRAERRFTQQALSVSLGHDLFAGWGGYIEAYGFSPLERGLGPGWTLDGGVSRLVGTRLQFDVEAGWGLTDNAPDWFIGFGFAIRGRMRGH